MPICVAPYCLRATGPLTPADPNLRAIIFGVNRANRTHDPCRLESVCLSRARRYLLSELVCDAELEKVLHHRQLIRDDQGATTGRRTTGTDSRVRSAECIEVAREIPEIGETILGTSYPTGPE